MWRWHLLAVLLMVVGTLGVYGQVRGHQFIHHDDGDYISDNRQVKAGLTREGVAWAFATTRCANWHPLTWLSHMIDCQLFGLDAGKHHLVNVGLHVCNGLLLYALLWRMTAAAWASAVVALLFLLHPLHVESVAWASERKDTLSTLFGLLAIAAYAAYARRGGLGRYALVLLMMALSLMAKPMLVTLPFLLLLLDYWPLRRAGLWPREIDGGAGAAPVPRRDTLPFLLLEKLPMLALSVLGSLATMYAQTKEHAVSALPLTSRLANGVIAYGQYVRRTFLPTDLALGYPHPGVLGRGIPAGSVVGVLAGLLIVTLLGVYWRRRFPWLAVGWFWFAGTLVPTLGLVQVGRQAMADRYTYVPLIGPFIVIAWAAHHALERWPNARRRLAQAAVAAPVLLACAWAARVQAGHWVDSVTLFSRALALNPDNYIARGCLGAAYISRGDTDKATEQYRRVIDLLPDNLDAHHNLGAMLLQQGRLPEALEHARAAVRVGPFSAAAHEGLANALAAAGDVQAAQSEYAEAIRLDPEAASPRDNLGRLLVRIGQPDRAVALFREAIALDPGYAPAHFSLGAVLQMQRRPAEAEAAFREALRLKPDWPEVLTQLAWLLANDPDPAVRRPAEAIDLARRAVDVTKAEKIAPLDTLAAAHAAAGDLDAALRTAEQALALAQRTGQPAAAEQLNRRIARYRAAKAGQGR